MNSCTELAPSGTRPAQPRWLKGLVQRPALALSVSLAGCLILAAHVGAVEVSWDDWIRPFTATSGGYVLWEIRLPRVLFAALVGAALGLSGSLAQGLFRNPLADPGLLGVTTGAAMFAALAIVFFASFGLTLPPSLRLWLLPAAAFSGALLVVYVLDRTARWLTPGSIAGLLLTGIALNALAGAVIGLAIYSASDEQLRSLSFWTLGSLAGANWTLVLGLAGLLALGLWWVHRLLQAMNALALGEAVASHLGIDVNALRGRVIVAVALLSGFAVAWTGVIGFIGLMAPNLVRLLIGPDQRQVAPLSALTGAIVLTLADTLARTAAIPAEIPVGIFTALLGGPFFLLLLRPGLSRGG
ncbi:MAG: FecCD family ABC transporter permease [Halothiobacillaceae bacterium]